MGLVIVTGLLVSRVDQIVVNLGYDWTSNPVIRIIAGLLVAWVLFLWYRRMKRDRQPFVYKEITETPAKIALIVFVSASQGKTPAESAIEFQKQHGKLRFCSLLYTADSDSNTTAIMQNHPSTTSFQIVPKRIDNDRNPSHVYDKVKEAISEAGRYASSSDDVLVDFTGGTKLATFAMAMAAQDMSTAVQYIYTPFNPDTKRLEFNRSRPMLLDPLSDGQLRASETEPVAVP